MVKLKVTGVISTFKCDHCDHNINFISTLSERSGSRLEVSRSEEQVVKCFRDLFCWKLKHHQVEQRDAGTEMAPRLEGSSGGAEDPRTGLGSDPKARILLSGDIESNPGPPRRFESWFEVENDNSDDKLVLLAENVDNVGKEGGILCRVVGMVVIKQLACLLTLPGYNQSWEMIADDDGNGG